jgi:hypothetical protein
MQADKTLARRQTFGFLLAVPAVGFGLIHGHYFNEYMLSGSPVRSPPNNVVPLRNHYDLSWITAYQEFVLNSLLGASMLCAAVAVVVYFPVAESSLGRWLRWIRGVDEP